MIIKKLLLFTAAFILVLNGSLFSQEKGKEEKGDSSETEEHKWWDDEDRDFDVDLFD